tara:strand:- start:29 stop:694 length:666 start_codon:yes stop_codon:yes gene_type:complete
VIPPKHNADFVAHMEDVLAVYERPYDPRYPVVCMDEQPTQLIEEIKTPIEGDRGQPERYDYEYRRNGTAVNFLFTEPLADWRKVTVRAHRTQIDWGQEIQHLLEEDYPDAEKVILVCDNLNTHTIASLYAAFPPQIARGLVERIALHFTPKHGSWLNIAEIELSILTRQCLDRRIPSLEALRKEADTWGRRRNAEEKTVDWQFTAADARIKLKRLYPQFKS